MAFEDLTDPVNRAVCAHLGIPAIWTPNGAGSPVSLRAVFRRAHAIFDDLGTPIASTSTTAHIRALDLPRTPIENDRISIADLEFHVSSMEPDGQGGITLVLVKAPPP